MKKSIFVCLLVLITPWYVAAQDKQGGKAEELESDRPTRTQSPKPKVVPRGAIQLEVGYEYNKDQNKSTRTKEVLYPNTLIRVGVLEKAELRINADYQKEITKTLGTTGATDRQRGFSNVQLGAKINIFEGKGVMPGIGFLGSITLPVGNEALRPPHIAPEALLLFNNKISDRVEVQYNAGYRKRQEQGAYQGEAVYSIASTLKLTDNIQYQLEFFGQKAKGATAENLLDTALLLKVLPNLQLDVIAGLGLNKSSPDYFAGGGVTCRLPR